MGARGFRKQGGGFLKGDGTLVSYQWSDEFNGKPFVPGRNPKTGKPFFHSLYFVPSILMDGAEEEITTTLFAGGFDDWDISEDGLTLTPADGKPSDQQLGSGTAFSKLVDSMIDAGIPYDSVFPEDAPEGEQNFEVLTGKRYRFDKIENENMKGKKRVDKKTGKEYAYEDNIVTEVYPDEKATAKAPAKGAKPVVKAGKAGKQDKAAALETLAKATLIAVVTEAGGSVPKNKVSTKIIQKMIKHPDREPLRTLIYSDAFLEQEDGWAYDGKTVTVEAGEDEDDE